LPLPRIGAAGSSRLTVAGGRLIERAFQKPANDVQEIMTVLKTNERAELVRLLKKVRLRN
jgi:hypothetical protein